MDEILIETFNYTLWVFHKLYFCLLFSFGQKIEQNYIQGPLSKVEFAKETQICSVFFISICVNTEIISPL